MHKKLAFAVVVAALVVLEGDAVALDPGACCVFSTSKMDAMLNPVRGGDEKFFTAAGGPPTVLFIIDTGAQMQNWPVDWPTITDGGFGCPSSNNGLSDTPIALADGGTRPGNYAQLVQATQGYDPAYNGGMTGGYGSGYGQLWTGMTNVNPNWFNDNSVWVAADAGYGDDMDNSGSPVGTNFPASDGGTALSAYIGGACATVPAAMQASCMTCLAQDGYFIESTERRLVTGHFLNYYGPRDASLVKALSDVVHDMAGFRLGIVALGASGGGAQCKSGNRMCIQSDFKPPCSQWPAVAGDSQKNSILGNFKNLDWGDASPLGDLLYAGAHYYHSKGQGAAPDTFSNNATYGLFPAGPIPNLNQLDEAGGSNRSICASCGYNTAILMSGSMPISDGNNGVFPDNVVTTLPSEITGLGVSIPNYTGPATELANVAKFFAEKDMVANNMTVVDLMLGKQKMNTYTVAFTTHPDVKALLRRTAKVGGGEMYAATNVLGFKAAVQKALDDIITRNTAFSSAAVPSLQTGSQQLNAVVPRMRPQAGGAWQGEIWRFRLANEFVLEVDVNGDGDMSDVFMVEDFTGDDAAFAASPPDAATIKQHLVVEDPNGDFVVANVDGSGNLTPGTTPATPAFEANKSMVTAGYGARSIWTVVDDKTANVANPEQAGSAGGDGAFTHHDTRLAFTKANANQLLPYLGISGTSFCPNLSTGTEGDFYARLEVSNAAVAAALSEAVPATQDESDVLCAKALIQWTRGQDLGDANGDGDRTDTRERVLGDVFHSSPIVVEPPLSDSFLCELGLSNQCIQTLYQTYLPNSPTQLEPLATAVTAPCGGTTTDPYKSFAWAMRQRPKLVLVGANDGMLHAFQGGSFLSETCTGGNPIVEHDPGTGQEVWAFIPPDALPRLREVPFGHTYLLDGDIMVRDIWADQTTAGTLNRKDQAEFHTLAIASEGRGGTHYFALEVPFNATTLAPEPPNFRWIYPQPCSREAITFGKTFYSLSPKPPPIGPVLIEASTNDKPDRGAGYTREGVSTNEVWVAMLSGGWSPMLERGRGVYMVDAWYGVVNGRRDNLWWKWEYNDSNSLNQQHSPRNWLSASVSAPVAMVDYGTGSRVGLDGYFDTGVVGDTFGQLWVLRFSKPGVLDVSTAGDERINNWSGARGFIIDKRNTNSTTAGIAGKVDIRNRWPFFFLPSIAIQPGTNALRAYIGSGDRVHLLDRHAGRCRFDNPLACSKYGCDEIYEAYQVRKGDYDFDWGGNWGMHTHWDDDNEYNHSGQTESTGLGRTACGLVEAQHDVADIDNCPGYDPDEVNEVRVTCNTLTPDGGNYNCTGPTVTSGSRQLDDLDTYDLPSNGVLDSLGRNRYYGVWLYGGNPGGTARTFVENATTGTSTAEDFDRAAITDRTSTDTTSGNLVDVTGGFCDQVGGCRIFGTASTGAPENGNGWYFELRDDYSAANSFTRASLEHKTATGSTVLAGCTLFSTLYPVTGNSCATVAQARSRFHQADWLTGMPNCADSFKLTDGGFQRFQERDVLAPPPELSTNVQLSKAGKIKYSSLVLEPSKSQATEISVTVGADILQSVYEVPLNQPSHNCRHGDAGCAAMTP